MMISYRDRHKKVRGVDYIYYQRDEADLNPIAISDSIFPRFLLYSFQHILNQLWHGVAKLTSV